MLEVSRWIPYSSLAHSLAFDFPRLVSISTNGKSSLIVVRKKAKMRMIRMCLTLRSKVVFLSLESYNNRGKKKSGTEGKQQGHYALLGLSHLSSPMVESTVSIVVRCPPTLIGSSTPIQGRKLL